MYKTNQFFINISQGPRLVRLIYFSVSPMAGFIMRDKHVSRTYFKLTHIRPNACYKVRGIMRAERNDVCRKR